MKSLFTLLISFQSFVLVFSQSAPIKFGKLKMDEFNMKGMNVDTSASAVVLIDFGRGYFQFDDKMGWSFYLDRIIRKKILSKEGYDEANLSIRTYDNQRGDREAIRSLKGYTYNLDRNALTKSKLGKSSVFIEKEDEHWRRTKVSMPDIQVGSVIEYQYTFRTPFNWNLPTWYFQRTIPVINSEYYITIPEYFDYQMLSSGYLQYAASERTKENGSLSYHYDSNAQMGTLHYNQIRYHWQVENAPAFKVEAYTSAANNYTSKMEFELRSTKGFDNSSKSYMGTWQSLTKTYLEQESFGKALEKKNFLKKIIEPAIAATITEQEKIILITNMIRKKVEWNDRHRDFTSQPLKKTWEEGKGNSADINLLLVAALRTAGVDADPVILSTRSHGMVRVQYAISKQFNSVVVLVKSEGSKFLLDATDHYVPIGVLPSPCLNGKGRIISKTNGGWINLTGGSDSQDMIENTMTISESGELAGKIKFSSKGYSAYRARKSKILIGEEKYVEKVKESNKSWLIEDYTFDEDKGSSSTFSRTYEISIADGAMVAGNLLMVNPMMGQGIDKNPFKLEKREYPVDFAYPIKKTYMLKLTIPDGYEVDEIPKSMAIALPDKGGKFIFNTSVDGGIIQITSIYQINKPMFVQTEYAGLKQFHQMIVSKHAEQVVLRKSTE